MKNKGLIKKLKGVGFVPLKGVNTTTLVKIIEGDEFNYNYTSSNFWKTESSNSCNIFDVTFPQILAAIKEHTGVDLTKKTKREEIEELKIKVASLEDAIKSQNEAIELNKKDAHRANDRLTMVLRRLKVLGVWKDEEVKEKVIEFGKYAEILEGHPSQTSYCEGVDVLVIDDTDRPNVTVVMNGHYPVDIHESNLKPL